MVLCFKQYDYNKLIFSDWPMANLDESQYCINSLVAALEVTQPPLYFKPQFLRNHMYCPVAAAETGGQS
jgi:hypothetical protein